MNPNKALWEKGDFTRTARASQTILLIKVSWINSLARACLTTSKRNVGFSRYGGRMVAASQVLSLS